MKKTTVKGEGLEKRVEKLDFHKLGEKVSHGKITRKIEDVSKDFDYLVTHIQNKTYEEDKGKKKESKLDEGVFVPKITPLDNQELVENIADELGVYFTRHHLSEKEAKNFENLIKKVKKRDFKNDDEEANLRRELDTVRNNLRELGFDWEGVKKHLGAYGLDDKLKESIKGDYIKMAPSYEASKYVNRITEEHKPVLIDHLNKVNPNLVKYKLMKEDLNALKSVFVQIHETLRRHAKPDEKKLGEGKLKDLHKHLYKHTSAVKSPYK